jgi:hypothetical protein
MFICTKILMEACNVHGSVSTQHPCFLTNVKDREAIRLAINLAKWESASRQKSQQQQQQQKQQQQQD